MANPYVGVVLRHDAVEVVQLGGRLFGGPRVVRSARVALPNGPQQDLAKDSAAVVNAIRTALSSAGIHAKRVAVALPPDDVLLRAFTIPAIPRAELDGAVQFEARKYLPFKLNELVWNYQVAPRSDKHITAIFVAVERTTLLRVRDWLKHAGLVPTCIEPYSFGFARTVQMSRRGRASGVVAAVDVAEGTAHIVLMKDELVYLARDVHFNHAGPGSGGAGESSSGDPQAERLASELRLSMEFFARAFADMAVERVLLFGAPALVNRWAGPFTAQLGCPVEAGILPVGQGQSPGGATSLAAAIGVALGAMRRGGSPFDLLKRNTEAQSPSPLHRPEIQEVVGRAKALAASLNRPVLGMCMAAAVALLILVWGVGSQQLASERHRLAQSVRSRPDVGFGLTGHSQEELGPARQQLQQQLALLRGVMDDRAPVASKMDALARALLDGVWLTGFTYQNELVATGQSQALLTLHGACFLGGENQELSAIRQFEEALKHHPAFFQGFSSSQMKEISAQMDPRQRYTYRTFQLTYSTERRL